MSEIVEVPINSDEIPEIIQPEPEPEPEPIPKQKPRPKGRPKGALGKKKTNKIPVNDVPQKKKNAKVITPSESEEDEVTPPRERKQQQPVPQAYEAPDTAAIAAQVLHLLSNQHLDRSAAKREKYRSWFS